MVSSPKYHSPALLLQVAGLRPTRQRLALAGWLFDGVFKHVTAEQTHAAMVKMRAQVSLATVYNTLNHLMAAGLLRRVDIDGGCLYFDTYVDDHHHIFDESDGSLTDIPPLRLAQPPKLPAGKRLSRVDIILRIHSER